MTLMLKIVDPRATLQLSAVAPRQTLASLSGKVVGFIDNTKPNFNHLIDDLSDVLSSQYGVRQVIKRGKRLQSIPAPENVLNELAEQCDLIITGSGD